MGGIGGMVGMVGMALLLTACGGGGEEVDVNGDEPGAEEGTPAEDGETAAAGGGVLVAGISGEPDELDPHATTAYASFQILENVYDTLVVPDAEGNFQPSLAESWETSDDGLTWTFTLRDDVTFHDGSTFDSADVVYSLERMMGDESSVATRFGAVEDVEAPDESTVVITLNAPTPNLLDNIGNYKGMSIISEDAADELDLATEANGTGPFTLDSFDASGATLSAFGDYWGEGPTLDGVEFQYITESAAALTALRSGEIHWTDNVPPQDIEDLQDDEDIELGLSPNVEYWYLALNQNRDPWSERDARRGVAFGLDREAITEATRFGAATVNQTAIPSDSFWFHDYAPYSHDPDQAQELLDSAGVEEGQELGLMVVTGTDGVQAAQVIQANLQEVGIEVQIEEEESATWLDRQSQGEFDAFMWSWIGNLDPFGFYHAQHVCEGNFNFQGYCSEDVDDLLTDAAAETDQDERKALYDQATELIVDDASYIYLYNPDVVQAWTPGLSGYEVRADEAINFEQVVLPE
ncbi:MAG: ABC transporter substrate-binding protein [Actinomycetota bacterium]